MGPRFHSLLHLCFLLIHTADSVHAHCFIGIVPRCSPPQKGQPTCPCSRHNPQLVRARTRSNKPVPLYVANTILSTLSPQAPRPCPRPAFRERSHASCTPHVRQLQATRACSIPMSHNKGLDMHTVTVWGATCNEHRARSPPRAAGTPAHTTFKAEQKPLLLLGKVWQTSYSSGSQAARPGAAGRADSLQGGRPG